MVMVIKIFLLSVLVTASMTLHARSQALLIGIGDYPNKGMKLEGPEYDVALINDLLLQSGHFSKDDIKILIDEEATRMNIISALNNLVKTTSKNGEDSVVIYFSGHGTSALDDNNEADIPPNTGALIPYDIHDVDSRKKLNERLLIGSRDLRPVLKELDGNMVEVLVLVDACFSGNVVRGMRGENRESVDLPVRFLDFSTLWDKVSSQNKYLNNTTKVSIEESHNESAKKTTRRELIEPSESDPYPYDRVFMISAANADQRAQDIPKTKLTSFPTVDSNPHGAFTNSLVEGLVNLYESNSENKEPPSLTDLHATTSRIMKKYLSKPRLLPEEKSITGEIDLQRFFGLSIVL